MAVADGRANTCHFASYIMYFQKVIGEEGLLAYCYLMSLSFHYDRRLILILASFISFPFEVNVTSKKF